MKRGFWFWVLFVTWKVLNFTTLQMESLEIQRVNTITDYKRWSIIKGTIEYKTNPSNDKWWMARRFRYIIVVQKIHCGDDFVVTNKRLLELNISSYIELHQVKPNQHDMNVRLVWLCRVMVVRQQITVTTVLRSHSHSETPPIIILDRTSETPCITIYTQNHYSLINIHQWCFSEELVGLLCFPNCAWQTLLYVLYHLCKIYTNTERWICPKGESND